MALPYPILKAGGAQVVDSAKAAQVAWDSVFENLDRANEAMKRKEAQTQENYGAMLEQANRASVHDEAEVNFKLEEDREWYAEQLRLGRNPTSARFISEFNQRMLDTEQLNGKAISSQKNWEENQKTIDGLSGYWKKGEMQKAVIANRAQPLAERNADILSELVNDPQYYDIEAKMSDLAEAYREALTSKVEGYEKDGDFWEFSAVYNPAIHRIKTDANGKQYVVYEVKPDTYAKHAAEDQGLEKAVRAEVEATELELKTKLANGEQLTEWEQKFLEKGQASNARGAMIMTKHLKDRVAFKMSDVRVGATEETKHKNRLKEIEARADDEFNEPSVHRQKRTEAAADQETLYNNITKGQNPSASISNLIEKHDTKGKIQRGSVRAERITEGPNAGLMKVTYKSRVDNDLKYRLVTEEWVEYIDPNSKGNVINTIQRIGEFDKKYWAAKDDTDARKLPERQRVSSQEELAPGVTKVGDKYYKDGVEINPNEKVGEGLSDEDKI